MNLLRPLYLCGVYFSGYSYALVRAAVAGAFDLIPGIGATIGISLICLIILPQGILLSWKV
jgi:predicted PurR-regulated permease PerM